MALTVTDSSTWEASELVTPEGKITYWVLADQESYYEQYEDDANLTRVQIAVGWYYALQFKRYALGFAEFVPGMSYFQRYAPLKNPFLTGDESQYLTSLRKVGRVMPGVSNTGSVSWHYADPLINNWPNYEEVAAGMPPRIVYEAVFSNVAWDVVDQSVFSKPDAEGGVGGLEIRRNVVRTKSIYPRERKVPAMGFEVTVDGQTHPIPEVGFIPYYDYRLRYLWTRVPRDRVPDTAIANCLLKANSAAFDWNPVTNAYGKYLEGDLVFTGLFQDIKPYRGTNGEWLVDVPYEFRYQPGDGTGDGMLKVPFWSEADGQIWVKPFVRKTPGSVLADKYLYTKTSFETLFQPEP
jgi:hypothetical protein